MKRILTVLLLLSSAGAARAVPVVPNFTQGGMTSQTETTSTVNETINSMDYNTGWQYVVTGTNVQSTSDNLTPGGTTQSNVTLDGVTSTWNGLDLNQRPEFTMTTPGAAFQFTESYQGPGLSNHTIIQRVTTINSVTNTTSTFTQ
tara:strand:+ start:84 stop:518 length:435 start_codon:yes stop_codon:yes gene_type:complete